MREQWRQGDVLFERIPSIPEQAVVRGGKVLFIGERTGHAHSLESETAEVFVFGRDLYLKAASNTSIVHAEHGRIVLEPGNYRVWRQIEYRQGRGYDVQD